MRKNTISLNAYYFFGQDVDIFSTTLVVRRPLFGISAQALDAILGSEELARYALLELEPRPQAGPLKPAARPTARRWAIRS